MAIEPAVTNLVKSLIEGVEKFSSGPGTNRVEELSSVAPVASGFPVSNVKKLSLGPSTNRADVTSQLPTNSVESSVLKPADIVSKSSSDSVQSSSSQPSVVSGENAASKGLAANTANQLFEDRIVNEHARWDETIKFLECDSFLHHVNEYSNWFNNSHQIVRHQSRPCVRPQALTTVTCAFGNLMAPKLVRCLEDSNLCVRQKALLWIVELVATPNGRYQCIKTGLLNALAQRLHEKDMFIKQQLAIAAGHLAGMHDACVEMSHLGIIKWLLKMVASTDDNLREASLTALLNAAFNETACITMENVKHKEFLE